MVGVKEGTGGGKIGQGFKEEGFGGKEYRKGVGG